MLKRHSLDLFVLPASPCRELKSLFRLIGGVSEFGGGVSLSKIAAGYRLYAAWCAELAKHVSDPGRRVALLTMAQDWLKLAEQVFRPERPTTEKAEPPHDNP